jgi:hypothetical protein
MADALEALAEPHTAKRRRRQAETIEALALDQEKGIGRPP